MYINDPQDIMRLIQSGSDFLLKAIRQGNSDYLEKANITTPESAYIEAAEVMSEISELAIGPKEAEKLFSLYPMERISITAYGVQRENCSFVLAHFFLGCRWPQNGDDIDIDAFVEVLKNQAQEMGFKIRR